MYLVNWFRNCAYVEFLFGDKADTNHVVLDYCSRIFPTRIKLGPFFV